MNNKKILICGNGPSLIDGLYNQKLDNFDYVLRLNNWKPIVGYDNRCDIWCSTFWHDIAPRTIVKHKNKIIWDIWLFRGRYPVISEGDIKSMYINYGWYTQDQKDKQKQVLSLLGKYPEYSYEYQNLEYFRKHKIKYNSPSSGMYAIDMAMNKQMDIYITGFDHFKCLKSNHHYYKETEPERNTTNYKNTQTAKPHDGGIESLFIRDLILQNKIKQYTYDNS